MLPATVENVVHISDFSLDSDTEIAAAMSIEDAKLYPNRYNVAGLVANYVEPAKRARLAKGLCMAMGMPDIPVGVGIASTARPAYGYEFHSLYPQPDADLPDGQEVLGEAFESSADGSVSLHLHSVMTDAAQFFENNASLVRRKLGRLFIQSGAKTKGGEAVLDAAGRLVPDDSFNLYCDQAASAEVFARAQAMVDMTLVSRWAVYACGVTFPPGALTREPMWSVAQTAARRMSESSDQYWRASHVPLDDPNRDLPPSRNREYVIESLLGGVDPQCSGEASIAHLVDKVSPFDAIMKFLSREGNVNRFCDPYAHEYAGHTHRVIGFDKNTDNIRPDNKQHLLTQLSYIYMDYLSDEPIWRSFDRY